MPARQRLVKLTTVLLPFLYFAVERRVKNKFCLLLTEPKSSLKFLPCKDDVQRRAYRSVRLHSRTMTNNSDLASRRST